jgi:conjugal transfer pilus assembly protein TraU
MLSNWISVFCLDGQDTCAKDAFARKNTPRAHICHRFFDFFIKPLLTLSKRFIYKRRFLRVVLAIYALLFSAATFAGATCQGSFINPATDICWSCMLPLSIGKHDILKSSIADSDTAGNIIERCGNKLGASLGYFEPMALVDVTDTPYCLVNLGGIKMNIKNAMQGTTSKDFDTGASSSFSHVHWYKYPIISILGMILEGNCADPGDFDVAYLSEMDASYKDSEMNFILNPEAALLASPVAQAACFADSVSSSTMNKPLDLEYWCAGSLGSIFPLNGHSNASYSPVQTSELLTERVNFKLHRAGLISDSDAKNPCSTSKKPITPKSRYRYQMVNQKVERHCHASGHTPLDYESGKIRPTKSKQYGYLVWRRRNCVFA